MAFPPPLRAHDNWLWEYLGCDRPTPKSSPKPQPVEKVSPSSEETPLTKEVDGTSTEGEQK